MSGVLGGPYSPAELGELYRWRRYQMRVDEMGLAERVELAGAVSDDPDELDPLLRDPDPRVRAALAANPHATDAQLRWLGREEWEHTVLVALASNPACPAHLVDRFIGSRDREIVRAAREAHPDWRPESPGEDLDGAICDGM